MRILTLDYECNVPGSGKPLKGGTARFARDFSEYAVSQGHAWFGIMQRYEKEGPAWKLIGAEEGKEFYTVRSGTMRINEVAVYKSPEELEEAYAEEIDDLRQTLRYLQPDIIFLNGFSQYSWLLYIAAAKEMIPTVMQHAGLWVRDLEAFADMCPPEYRVLAKKMEQDATEGVTANIFLNKYSMEALEKDLDLTCGEKCHVIPLPHTGWDFNGTCAPKERAARKIGVVARWDRIKNHDAVLAFAEEVHKRNLPWEVIAVTAIPETPARADFKARYRELITVVPYMSRQKLHDFFGELDAAILPSRFETAGGVVMEAAAVGIPTLISPNVGWVSEYEETGMRDWVVDFAKPEEVVAQLEKQFARAAWPELEQFVQYLKRGHDPKRIYDQYLSLFTRLAAVAAL